jgi:hypothetical protein
LAEETLGLIRVVAADIAGGRGGTLGAFRRNSARRFKLNDQLTRAQIWFSPIVLGIVSAIGITAALLGDGLWDVVSWVALAAPVLVCLYFIWKPATTARKDSSHAGGRGAAN